MKGRDNPLLDYAPPDPGPSTASKIVATLGGAAVSIAIVFGTMFLFFVTNYPRQNDFAVVAVPLAGLALIGLLIWLTFKRNRLFSIGVIIGLPLSLLVFGLCTAAL